MTERNLPIHWMVETLQQQVDGLLESAQDHGACDAGWTFHMAYVRLLPILDLLKRQYEWEQDQLAYEKRKKKEERNDR